MIVSLYYVSIVSHAGLFIFRSCATITPYTMSSSCPGCGVPGAGSGLSPQSATGPITTRSFEPGVKTTPRAERGEEKPEPTVKTGHLPPLPAGTCECPVSCVPDMVRSRQLITPAQSSDNN